MTTLDGINIATWGMFILRGGDYDLLSFPERKEPVMNKWFEDDGVDVDLSEIYFKEKKVTLKFYLSGTSTDDFLYKLDAFYDHISSDGYHQLYTTEFDKTYSLRYVSCPSLKQYRGLVRSGEKSAEISVEFSLDDPLSAFSDHSDTEPLTGYLLADESKNILVTDDAFAIQLFVAGDIKGSQTTGVMLSGVDLAAYGIVVQQVYDTALALAPAQKPLERSFALQSGLVVGRGLQTFAQKQITIECCMLADTRANFMYNWQSLFNALSVLGSLSIQLPSNRSYNCYYSGMASLSKLSVFESRPAVKFSLNLKTIDTGLTRWCLGDELQNILLTNDNYALTI